MKIKFTNFDVMAEVKNLEKYIDYRLINVYELNLKQFILKLTNKKEKVFIKLVSGFRFHTIDDKPDECKQMPNTFTQKMRKHMNNKRLTGITQLGLDRIVDFKFGEREFAYHIILEIYSTGNVILTDNDYKILSLQRKYVNNEINISVGEVYDISYYNQIQFLDKEKVEEWLKTGSMDLMEKQSPFSQLGKQFLSNYRYEDWKMIIEDYKNLDLRSGYLTNQTYSPFPNNDDKTKTYENFDEMVCEFYKTEQNNSKKNEKKNGKNKINKYERAKKEFEKRVQNMDKKMNKNEVKANWLYENATTLDFIIDKVNEMDRNYVEDYFDGNGLYENFGKISYNKKDNKLVFEKMGVEIDCGKSAYANGDAYFSSKKAIKKKYDKTVESGGKAMDKLRKNEEKREEKKKMDKEFEYEERSFWFQDYNWYIMDNRYLMIGGKNADQNEELVKKYMEKNDKYIHGDFFGSSSVIVKDMKRNNLEEIPLQVLLRAGDLLVCMSNNWKVSRSENSYYVNPEQVSKTAPSGEYLTKGSFMIRGQKNYLPNSNLELGVGILFVDGKGDEIEYISKPEGNKKYKSCIPVLGSFRDMRSKYKYVVKIKPGNQKQGKIINGILSRFMKQKDANDCERFLIKKVNKDLWCKIIRSHSHLV